MKAEEFDTYMKSFMADTAVIPSETFIALHIDGDNFSKFTKDLEKPFDENFHDAMLNTAAYLVKQFNAIIAYIQFDEINLILAKNNTMFNRKIGKLISKASSLTTIMFKEYLDIPCKYMTDELYYGFATHVYNLPTWEQVIDYMNWRRADCKKNSLSTIVYWQLRGEGNTPKKCASLLNKTKHSQKLDMLKHRGVEIKDLPYWQRKGSTIFWRDYLKKYQDHNTGEEKTTLRREPYVVVNDEEYEIFMGKMYEVLS